MIPEKGQDKFFSNEKCIKKWDKKWDKYHWLNMWHRHSKILNFSLLYWFIWSIWWTYSTNHDSRNLSHFLSHFLYHFSIHSLHFIAFFTFLTRDADYPKTRNAIVPLFVPLFEIFKKFMIWRKFFPIIIFSQTPSVLRYRLIS